MLIETCISAIAQEGDVDGHMMQYPFGHQHLDRGTKNPQPILNVILCCGVVTGVKCVTAIACSFQQNISLQHQLARSRMKPSQLRLQTKQSYSKEFTWMAVSIS